MAQPPTRSILGVVVTLARVIAAAWLVITLLACCTSRTVMQSGLVPFAEPPPPPSSHAAADVAASASGLAFVEPEEVADNLGHYVPAAQVHIAGMLRPVRGVTLRPTGMLAIPSGATPLRPDLIAQPDLPSFALGVDVGYTIGDEDDPLFVRPHFGPVLAGLATRVADPWPGPSGGSEIGWMILVQGGLDLGYWVTPEVLLLAGVDVRNTPRVEALVSSCDSTTPFVDFGDASVTARVSAEVELTNDIALFASVAVPALASGYGPFPILSFGARLSAGEARHGLVRRRVQLARPPRESTPAEEAAAERLADPRLPTDDEHDDARRQQDAGCPGGPCANVGAFDASMP